METHYSQQGSLQKNKYEAWKNTYLKMLRVMHDNADGRNGAFSIQNIVRMSLLYNKYPGEWHGPGSISNVFKDLNKLY